VNYFVYLNSKTKSREEMDPANVYLRRSLIILFVICFLIILHWKPAVI